MTKVTGNYHRKMPSGAELNITIEAENYYEISSALSSALTFLLGDPKFMVTVLEEPTALPAEVPLPKAKSLEEPF